MPSSVTSQTTLLSTLWPEAPNSVFKASLLVLLGTGLLTLSAKLSVPFYPYIVPMTMQTFAVLVIGMALGWKLGAATVMLYLIEGALGLPVFAYTPAKGIGISYMVGPTGGYLIGFLLSAALLGYLGERGFDRNIGTTLAAMLMGTVVIFVFGYSWLAYLIGAEKAFLFGVYPFLWAEAFKIALAALVLPTCWKLLGRRSRSKI